MTSNIRQNLPDSDPDETIEWLESLRSVASTHGINRARFLLHELMNEAQDLSIPIKNSPISPYANSISVDQDLPYPGNLDIESKIQNIILWNAAVMVSDANRRNDGRDD